MTVRSHTEQEILSQPDVWRETLAQLDVPRLGDGLGSAGANVVVTGCGSAHYLALTAASLLRAAGRRAWAVPASELLPDAEPVVTQPRGTVMLAFSRSGTTTETVRAVERFRRLGGESVVAVTCDPDSELARAADVVWVTAAAAERSVAQTRSFSTMLLVAQAIAGALAGHDPSALDKLPAHAERLLADARVPVSDIARDRALTSFYFLASDPLFGVASEGMLKLKEMSLTASEAYHSLEFRHGPMSMCDASAVVVGLVSPERAARELAVLDDVRAHTGRIVTIGDRADLHVPGSLPRWVRPVLYLVPLQLLALERALAKGLDPDHPRHLTAVIHLDVSAETP
jgi:glucosamine--fructose-6-phosphate aminotransferase (isomerizing)